MLMSQVISMYFVKLGLLNLLLLFVNRKLVV